MAEVTIDRETRQLLRHALEFKAMSAENFDYAVRRGQQDEARSVRDEMAFVVEMLDLVGWEQEAQRDEYTFDVDPERFRSWIHEEKSSLQSNIGDSVVVLAKQERGEEGHFYAELSQAESIEETRGYIERDRQHVERLYDVLGQLRPTTAVA